jgi:hypothetical protein
MTAKGDRFSRAAHVDTGYPSISPSVLRRTTLTYLLHPDNLSSLLELGNAGARQVINALYNTSDEVIQKHYQHQGIELEKRPELLTAWLTEGTATPEMQAFVQDLLPTALNELSEAQSSTSSPLSTTSSHGLTAAEAAARRHQFNCPSELRDIGAPIAASAQEDSVMLKGTLSSVSARVPRANAHSD